MANQDDICGCCKGTETATPESAGNRPGLSALDYRIGRHATFLDSMNSRLSSHSLDIELAEFDEDGNPKKQRIRPLQDLRIRDESDPSIALMDAWATVADVLTFYQERIANEGYLRTATERYSVMELAGQIGYTLKPGVAASVSLALEVEKGYSLKIQPYELKAQTVPDPGELPQTFENTEEIEVNYAWNWLQPRLQQPQTIGTITGIPAQPRIYVKGINTNLKPNDLMLITENNQPRDLPFRVAEVKPDSAKNHTLVTFQPHAPAAPAPQPGYDFSLLIKVAEKYADPAELKKFRVSAQREMAQRVMERLRALTGQLKTADITADTADHAIRETLSAIAEEKKMASDEQYKRMLPWLEAMLSDLNKVVPGRREAMVADAVKMSDPLKNAMVGLMAKSSLPPRNAISLDRDMADIFKSQADAGVRMAGAFHADLLRTLPATLANVTVTPDSQVRAYAFRAAAHPFGHNAPRKSRIEENINKTETGSSKSTTVHYDEWTYREMEEYEELDGLTLYLDAQYEKVVEGSWIVLDTGGVAQSRSHFLPAESPTVIGKVSKLKTGLSRAAYGISGPNTSTQVIDAKSGNCKRWFTYTGNDEDPDGALRAAMPEDKSFQLIRKTAVYLESEELELVDEPIETSIGGDADEWIELDGLYSGLQSGRWLIVAGERDDIKDDAGISVRGIHSAELVMLAEITQKPKEILSLNGMNPVLPGDQTHTFIKLAENLHYCYRRNTAIIYGNVVRATHGETRKEVLGSGDGRSSYQLFQLKQSPLTHVAASNPSGTESSLKVFVNDMQWHETSSLATSEQNDRHFITQTDNDAKTTVLCGDGVHGLRLPTGIENIQAVYRNGIGKGGNVRAEQISQLLSKPLGVKGVVNPLRASGGADRESRDSARTNAPRTVAALDRLVSVPDYADFARSFAGIGKALAAKISDGKREWVHVTIAGADDIPIDETSDLFVNLSRALHANGDPYQPVFLQVRELFLLLISANISIATDYRWETVAAEIRNALLKIFGFERRTLGQDVRLSEVIATMQAVRGVAYVDVDLLGGIPEKMEDVRNNRPIRRLLTPMEIAEEAQKYLEMREQGAPPRRRLQVNLAEVKNGIMQPAQLSYLSPHVADTLVINQIK
jgi:hypothetical protein